MTRGSQGVDHPRQQLCGRNGEAGVPHVVRVGEAVAAQPAQEREHLVSDHREHLVGFEVLERRPAQPLLGRSVRRVLDRLPGDRARFSARCCSVQHPQEEQVSDLLDHLQRVEMPPDQNAFQTWTTLLRSVPVITVRSVWDLPLRRKGGGALDDESEDTMVNIYTDPMLNVADAATYIAMPSSTLGAWRKDAIVHSVAPDGHGHPSLPFVAVIEAFVLRSLTEAGFPRKRVRGG